MSTDTQHTIDETGIVYNSERCTVLLTVPESVVAFDVIQPYLTEHNLVKKPEFHLTLIGFSVGRKIKDVLDRFAPAERKKAEDLFLQLVHSYEWKYQLKKQFFLLQKEYTFHKSPKELRRSVIELVEMSAVHDLYESLNISFSLELEKPFPHITLATWSDNTTNAQMGIGINSKTDFESLQPTLLSI